MKDFLAYSYLVLLLYNMRTYVHEALAYDLSTLQDPTYVSV